MIPISQVRKLRLRKLSDLPRFYSKTGLFYFKAHTQTLGYCVYIQLYMGKVISTLIKAQAYYSGNIEKTFLWVSWTEWYLHSALQEANLDRISSQKLQGSRPSRQRAQRG